MSRWNWYCVAKNGEREDRFEDAARANTDVQGVKGSPQNECVSA
jgi:hypothetical protein